MKVNGRIICFISGFVLVAISQLAACATDSNSSTELKVLGNTVPLLHGIIAVQRDPSLNSEKTQCVKFLFENSGEFAGDFCATRDNAFLQDQEIISLEDLPPGSRPSTSVESGLVILTPMTVYPMQPFLSERPDSYYTIIDCDEVGASIYRATSSCQVAILKMSDGLTMYSNFFIKNHIDKIDLVPESEIRKLWINILLNHNNRTK